MRRSAPLLNGDSAGASFCAPPDSGSHAIASAVATVVIRSGHVQPVWAGHPWVYAQAIAVVEGAPAPGDVVVVRDAKGHFLGRGFFSPKSAIAVRILARDENDPLDDASIIRRIEAAAEARRRDLGLPSEQTTGFRLIHSEGDRLGGLIVDQYESTLTVQFLSIGMKLREDVIFGALSRVTGARTIIEVHSEKNQKLEGFEAQTRVARGPDASALHFRERGFMFEVDPVTAQKTGYFFDQRENRGWLETQCKGKRVLDAYCYLGGFALSAARGGGTVVAADSSATAIAQAASAARNNGLDSKIEFVRADVKRFLPELVQKKERFDVVVIDPPKLAPTVKHLDEARRAYRKLNMLALELLGPGGLLVSCSCSGAMRQEDFLRTIGMAAADARREVALFDLRGAAPDHPVPVTFAEGRYLKCALVRVL